MSNEEILKAAINKTLTNGWIPQGMENTPSLRVPENILANYYNMPIFIFSHDFAKAFFGEKPDNIEARWELLKKGEFTGFDNFTPDTVYSRIVPMSIWQYHLQQLVLESDPIKYLEKYL